MASKITCNPNARLSRGHIFHRINVLMGFPAGDARFWRPNPGTAARIRTWCELELRMGHPERRVRLNLPRRRASWFTWIPISSTDLAENKRGRLIRRREAGEGRRLREAR